MVKLLLLVILFFATALSSAQPSKHHHHHPKHAKIEMDSHTFATKHGPVLPAHHPVKNVWLFVDPNSHRGYLYIGSQLQKRGYIVSTANPAHPQPCGWGRAEDGEQWPAFSASPGERAKLEAAGLPTDVGGKDPDNPFGAYRARLGDWRYRYICLHGNNDPKSIGFSNTNGCVMFGNADITALAQLLHRRHQPFSQLRVYIAPVRARTIPA